MTILITIALVIYFIARQIRQKQVTRTGFLILPVVLALQTFQTLPQSINFGMQAELLITAVLSIGIGLWQATLTEVFTEGGQVYSKVGANAPQYLLAWAVLVLGRFAIRMVFQGGLQNSATQEWLLWAGLALTWITRSVILYLRYPVIARALQQSRTQR